MISGEKYSSRYYLATLAGILAILLWASNIAFSKSALDRAGTYNGAFYIYFGSGLVLFSIMLVFQRKTKFLARLKNLPFSYYIKTGIFFMLNNVLLFLALGMARKNEELIIVTLLNYTWPVMIYLLRIPIFRLKTPMGVFIPGMLLSLSGIALALLQDYNRESLGMLITAGDENVPAYLLAFLTSVSWALYSNLTVKYKNEDDMAAIPVIFVASGLIFLGIQAVNGQLSTLQLSAATVGPDLLYTIIGPTSMGYLCWYIAMKNGNRTLITALSFFIPVLSLVFLRIRVNLEISPVFWIAVILLISGSYLCYRALRSSTLHIKAGDQSRR
jgi:drug/metabolite transporter (DMT)-like permease